ncbi:hypothetical protein A3Q56_05609 [Intoshia linei]|uniref:Uncharacterized protein n=1 Tax=Intoshia linei TaxID=1819745 RepID=A0A177AXG7_9BILA|nr:hypothetical protein A3Q56_05609 [Intoshia linei]
MRRSTKLFTQRLNEKPQRNNSTQMKQIIKSVQRFKDVIEEDEDEYNLNVYHISNIHSFENLPSNSARKIIQNVYKVSKNNLPNMENIADLIYSLPESFIVNATFKEYMYLKSKKTKEEIIIFYEKKLSLIKKQLENKYKNRNDAYLIVKKQLDENMQNKTNMEEILTTFSTILKVNHVVTALTYMLNKRKSRILRLSKADIPLMDKILVQIGIDFENLASIREYRMDLLNRLIELTDSNSTVIKTDNPKLSLQISSSSIEKFRSMSLSNISFQKHSETTQYNDIINGLKNLLKFEVNITQEEHKCKEIERLIGYV